MMKNKGTNKNSEVLCVLKVLLQTYGPIIKSHIKDIITNGYQLTDLTYLPHYTLVGNISVYKDDVMVDTTSRKLSLYSFFS